MITLYRIITKYTYTQSAHIETQYSTDYNEILTLKQKPTTKQTKGLCEWRILVVSLHRYRIQYKLPIGRKGTELISGCHEMDSILSGI